MGSERASTERREVDGREVGLGLSGLRILRAPFRLFLRSLALLYRYLAMFCVGTRGKGRGTSIRRSVFLKL